jgi:hypothetical protein
MGSKSVEPTNSCADRILMAPAPANCPAVASRARASAQCQNHGTLTAEPLSIFTAWVADIAHRLPDTCKWLTHALAPRAVSWSTMIDSSISLSENVVTCCVASPSTTRSTGWPFARAARLT